MKSTADMFSELCHRAQDEKEMADAKRNDAIVRHICTMLTAAVQNGEQNDEMLTHRAKELINEAADARSTVECDEDDGGYGFHLMAVIQLRVEEGKVSGVRNAKDADGQIIIGKIVVA